jgi:hypothetical protein
MALAGMAAPPAVILVNHSDHLLWLGVRAVDLVLSTRHSGDRLTRTRRGIGPGRTAVIPLCVERSARRLDREEAKRRLGLPAESVVLLTVARGAKFRSMGAEEFPDPLVPLLRAHPEARLVAVGPGGRVDWSAG